MESGSVMERLERTERLERGRPESEALINDAEGKLTYRQLEGCFANEKYWLRQQLPWKVEGK
jgi:hypothetical protein